MKCTNLINNYSFRKEFSSHDCFIIGQQILKSNDYNDYFYAIHWLKESHNKYQKEKEDETFTKNHISMILTKAYNATGQMNEAKNILEKMLKENPNHINLEEIESFLQNINEQLYNLYRLNNPQPRHNEIQELYSKACRGALQQDIKITSKLMCRFEGKSPFSQIAPFKVEEVNLNPYILLFHDVVYKSEIAILRELSKPKFARSTVQSSAGVNIKSSFRTSKIAWLYKNQHQSILDITKRVEDMTGLSTKFAEPLQTQNYGTGGHYDIHLDALSEDSDIVKMQGNRIATILFYVKYNILFCIIFLK